MKEAKKDLSFCSMMSSTCSVCCPKGKGKFLGLGALLVADGKHCLPAHWVHDWGADRVSHELEILLHLLEHCTLSGLVMRLGWELAKCLLVTPSVFCAQPDVSRPQRSLFYHKKPDSMFFFLITGYFVISSKNVFQK